MSRKVRVRFAPSPTGALHIGGVRTALYNYLFARQHGGTMILRIEDTDQTRFVEGAEEYIRKSLEWVGIELDESPWNGGQFAPYRQSERKTMYMEYAMRLINEDKAYYAFDTAEELEAIREKYKAGKTEFQYNALTRKTLNNSLNMTKEEVQKRLDNGDPYVIRIKISPKDEIRFRDQIRDWIVVHGSTLDDKVLMKSDGMPTYHLANIVDDHLMQITHVIRGEEWLPSAPLHVILYRYFGWEDTMPEFAHLPLLLKPNGEGKLSKRDGDQLGFPVFPLNWYGKEGDTAHGFKEAGYLPEAMINFLALLGWNGGTEQEIFSMAELIEQFSLERIHKAGSRFDINKAKWFNQHYLRQKSNSELAEILLAELAKNNIPCSAQKAERICGLMKDRVTFPQELWSEAKFFHQNPETYDEKVVSKKWNAEAIKALKTYSEAISTYSGEFDAENAKHLWESELEKVGIGAGKVMQPLRLAITGLGGGADLMQIIELIGKNATVERIEKAINTIGV